MAEHRHRQLLRRRAPIAFDWMFCFDPDERVTGDLRGFAGGMHVRDCDAARIQLFDAYITPDDCAPYRAGQKLLDFRRFFGLSDATS